MDLHSGRMLWPSTYDDAPQYPLLTENVSCDVLVIGGGEAGALSAWFLSEAGLDTIVIDKRAIGRGSTAANTGLLQFHNDMLLHQMALSHGVHEAVHFYKLCQQAIDDLEKIASQMELPTEFTRRDSLLYASVAKDVGLLEDEFRILRNHDFQVEFLTKRQIYDRFSFEKPAALYTVGDAEVNPYRLAHSLVHDASHKNLRVFEMTEVESTEFTGNQPLLHTTSGYTIRAKKVIIAAGYETQETHSTPGAQLGSSYAIATEPLTEFPGWHKRALIWETARPYLYLRTTADNRIVAGGLDEGVSSGTSRDEQLAAKADELRSQVRRLFPLLEEVNVEYSWVGTFGSSRDGLPFVGEHPSLPNCYLDLGYGGNGTVYYTIAAKILRDLIVYNHNPDAYILKPSRLRWYKQALKKVGQTIGVY